MAIALASELPSAVEIERPLANRFDSVSSENSVHWLLLSSINSVLWLLIDSARIHNV